MFISDIPPHDMSWDYVVLAEQCKIEAELAQKLVSPTPWNLNLFGPIFYQVA